MSNEFLYFNSSGKVDISPELAKQRAAELDRIAKQFGGGEGVDMTSFPKFSFPGMY